MSLFDYRVGRVVYSEDRDDFGHVVRFDRDSVGNILITVNFSKDKKFYGNLLPEDLSFELPEKPIKTSYIIKNTMGAITYGPYKRSVGSLLTIKCCEEGSIIYRVRDNVNDDIPLYEWTGSNWDKLPIK